MRQVILIKAIQENSGFFNKIIFQGQLSVEDVHVKNLVFLVACLVGILLRSALKSVMHMSFQKAK